MPPVDDLVLSTLDASVASIARRIIDGADTLDPTDLRELGVAAWYAACARDNLTQRPSRTPPEADV